ncbi:ABC transporter ATP-binding protein, partial [Buchnera aphidicola]|nr:ABC transporter ATP-binding protein [Buchnera aphidicola]
GKIVSWPGNYQNFVKLKNQNNNIEKEQKKIFQKKLNKEEQWIRKSTKARCTRNEGRVNNLKLLRNISKNYNEIE